LQNVFPIEIGILRQEFIDTASGSDLSDDHTHSNAHPANASLAAHNFRALCDAIQRFDAGSPTLAILQYYSKPAGALNEPCMQQTLAGSLPRLRILVSVII
jgi:hypothetical protein